MREAINDEKYNGSIIHEFYSQSNNQDGSVIPHEDRLILRGRKPMFKRIDKSLSLNFEGRVKKASRKNIQIVSFKLFNRIGLQIQN